MHVTNKQDMPGWDVSFDDVNIHFHGMQIVPHLFYPQGTANPVSNNGLVTWIRLILPLTLVLLICLSLFVIHHS